MIKIIKLSCFVSLFTFVISSCTSKEVTTIKPIDQVSQLSPRGMIYSLPRTNLRVKVTSDNVVFKAGPYAQFAEKYLGIKDVNIESFNYWQISAIEVYTLNEPDLQSLFVVEPAPNFSVDFLQLAKDGLIIPVSEALYGSFHGQLFPKSSKELKNDFVDMSPSPFIAEEQTTHYSRVFQDSMFVRVPVHKSIVIEKSIEDKAQEAAELIFSLRKRRVELLSGDADFIGDGDAAEITLKEISRLENQYLDLFLGKTFNSSNTSWFDYIPAQESNSTSILFRFSSAKGILPVSDLSGSPVLISLSFENKWSSIDLLNNLSVENGIQRPDAVYYRIPVPVNVKIIDSQNELYSRVFTFYQYGPLVRIPSEFILNNSKAIIFPKYEK